MTQNSKKILFEHSTVLTPIASKRLRQKYNPIGWPVIFQLILIYSKKHSYEHVQSNERVKSFDVFLNEKIKDELLWKKIIQLTRITENSKKLHKSDLPTIVIQSFFV